MRRTLNDSVPDLLLRLMVERSPDAVALVTPDGTPGFLNTVARELALGVRWTDWWDEPDRGTARAALREADLTGTTRTVTLARTPPDGERAWWTVTVTPVPEADPTRLMCVARDVTRDLAEREDAARQAGRLSRVLNAGPDAFLLLDRAWRVTHVNDRALALLRRPDGASVAGLTLWDLLPDLRDTDADTRLHAAAAARSPEVLETYLADLDLWCELHVSPAEDGVGLSVRDVTARKTAEQIARDRNHVLEMTLRGEPLTAVLEEIALIVERQLPDCWCSVMLVRDGRLHTGAAPSLPQGFNASVDGVPVRDGAGSCGTAAARGEDVMVEDVTTHPAWQDYRELAAAYGLRACRSRPILSGDEVLGTLALYAATPGPLPDGDVLEQARHLAAVAILHTRLSERLRHQAQHDPLTDLPNRSAFARRLQAAIDRAARHEEPLSMLFVDLDDFKTINDTLGHLVGDEVLREAARRLTSVVRRGDTLARIGGDEFTLILPSAGETQAVAVAQRVLGTLQTPFHAEDRDLFLTGSVGVSVFPEGGADGPTLLRHADLAMYQAKVRRAGVTVFRPEMTRDAHERLQLGHELRRALDEDELELHYQPQVRLASGVVAGVEALVRWRHPRLGLVPPARFVPLAEESCLITRLGAWVLREACRRTVEWQRGGRTDLRVAVNVSPRQFERRDFVESVAATLVETGLPPACLELELTESVVMRDVRESAVRMEELRELGVSVAVDDFGTGYSSLSYLQRLPLTVLKIDRSFIRDLGRERGTLPVVRAIAGLAHNLGLTTVAEGVERPDELDVLRELGVPLVQGYLLARPVPPDEVSFDVDVP